MPVDKRTPILADRFLAMTPHNAGQAVDDSLLARLQARARLARRFVLDDDAATRVGEVVRSIPELLIRESAFARAPFDIMWIEYPHWRYWRAITDNTEKHAVDADHTVGYLIDHNSVVVVTGGTVSDPLSKPYVGPISYQLNTEWPLQEQIDFAEFFRTSRAHLDAFMWGQTINYIGEQHQRLLRSHNAITILPLAAPVLRKLQNKDRAFDVLMGGAGELRTVIALLLMLNRPTLTRYAEVPKGHGWLKNRRIPFSAHSTVQIDLDAVATLKMVGTPQDIGVPRRRHEVRGHYCHDKTARNFLRMAGCVHDWQPTPHKDDTLDLPCHWTCAVCGGQRWWRRDHIRGDAAVGFVQHDAYAVTA